MSIRLNETERQRAQELFTRAVNGMAEQDFKQSRENTDTAGCAYRSKGPKGDPRKCIVGQLIPDELYSVAMDHGHDTSIGNRPDVQRAIGLDPKTDGALVDFLSACQFAHDSCESPSHMRQMLLDVAVAHNLVAPNCLLPGHA